MSCIIPPHMLENIMKHGNPAQKQRALKTLTLAGQMRGSRQSLFHVDFPVTSAAVPEKHRLVYSAEYGTDIPGKLMAVDQVFEAKSKKESKLITN